MNISNQNLTVWVRTDPGSPEALYLRQDIPPAWTWKNIRIVWKAQMLADQGRLTKSEIPLSELPELSLYHVRSQRLLAEDIPIQAPIADQKVENGDVLVLLMGSDEKVKQRIDDIRRLQDFPAQIDPSILGRSLTEEDARKHEKIQRIMPISGQNGLYQDDIQEIIKHAAHQILTQRDIHLHLHTGHTFSGDFKSAILNVESTLQDVNQNTRSPQKSQSKSERKTTMKNAWVNGSFYLVVFAVVITGLGVLGNTVSLSVLPIVLVAGILFVLLIGVLQLRQDKNLSEKSLIELMKLVIGQLPLIGKIVKRKEQ